jgi:hypothetical protein
VARLTETQRIVALENKRNGPLPDLTGELKTEGGTMHLRPLQSEALQTIRQVGGGFFPIGVGHGKTMIALLAGTVLKSELAIILCPASVRNQMSSDAVECYQHFKQPRRYEILSYEGLSRPDGTDLLEQLSDGVDKTKIVLVCDEAHRMKRMQSSRTKRLIRFMQANPEVRFIALSGTMTARSLRDFGHLAELALRESSPVPRDRTHLESWSQVIDAAGRPGPTDWERVRPLWNWAYPDRKDQYLYTYTADRQELMRKAFQKRMRSTFGVVASRAGSLGCSLVLLKHDAPCDPKIEELIRKAVCDDEDPAGNVILDDLHKHRIMRQLGCGYYHEWDWGDTPEDIQEEWMLRRRNWFRFVRNELENNSCRGYDSPKLVTDVMQAQLETGAARPQHRALALWNDSKDKADPKPLPVWVDKGIVTGALEHVRQMDRPTILWYEGRAVENMINEMAGSTGIHAYGAQARGNWMQFDTSGKESIALSIKAHGIGKNLQAWSNQIVLTPPSGGLTWEQLLGRTHRAGQEADEVECIWYGHTSGFCNAMMRASSEAEYIENTTGNVQKLNIASWNNT